MTRRHRALLLLALAALVAGCAAGPGGSDDQDQRPTFYGGVTGGSTLR